MLPDTTYGYGTCKSLNCQGRILWVILDKGGKPGVKGSPHDPLPTSQGNIALTGDGRGRVMGLKEIEEDTTGERFQSHFITCPDRAKF